MRNPETFRRMMLAAGVCLCVAIVTTSGAGSQGARRVEQDGERGGARQGRIRPPEGLLSCDRNHTTSFTGRVTAYARTSRHIYIRVRTDEQTTEQFTIALRRGEDASKKFLFQGEAFRRSDWQKVESRRGVLKPRMRAIIWACRDDQDDFRAELIDWRPAETEGSFVL